MSAPGPPASAYAPTTRAPTRRPDFERDPRTPPVPRPEDQRGDREEQDQLDERAHREDDARQPRATVGEEDQPAQQCEADQEVVVTTVDHDEDRGVEPDERERRRTPGPLPHDPQDAGERGGFETLEEQADGERRRARERRPDPGEDHEHGSVHRCGMAPPDRDEMQQRIAGEVGGHTCERVRVMRREDPAVHRVRPEVMRAARGRDDGDRDEERRRDEHPPTGQRVRADARREQGREAGEGHDPGCEPAGRAELPVAGERRRAAEHESGQGEDGGDSGAAVGRRGGAPRRQEKRARRVPGCKSHGCSRPHAT